MNKKLFIIGLLIVLSICVTSNQAKPNCYGRGIFSCIKERGCIYITRAGGICEREREIRRPHIG